MSSQTTFAGNFSSEILPMRILIVEDDALMQLGLEQCLGKYPQLEIVGQEADGYMGVEMALELKPDLVIMDIGLPQMDGIDATQQIKATLPEMRVVMLTSHTADVEMIAAFKSGANAYCIKGSKISGLLRAMTYIQEGGVYIEPTIAEKVIENTVKPNRNSKNSAANAQLSERELEVLKLVVEGMSNTEIAAALYVSPSTVKTHLKSVMNKLAVNDRVTSAVAALRSGLV